VFRHRRNKTFRRLTLPRAIFGCFPCPCGLYAKLTGHFAVIVLHHALGDEVALQETIEPKLTRTALILGNVGSVRRQKRDIGKIIREPMYAILFGWF
jgi:hypothetical protein